jgi:hypothetical protein
MSHSFCSRQIGTDLAIRVVGETNAPIHRARNCRSLAVGKFGRYTNRNSMRERSFMPRIISPDELKARTIIASPARNNPQELHDLARRNKFQF